MRCSSRAICRSIMLRSNWAVSSSKFSPSSLRLRSISCSKSWRRFSISCRCRAAQNSCLSRSRSWYCLSSSSNRCCCSRSSRSHSLGSCPRWLFPSSWRRLLNSSSMAIRCSSSAICRSIILRSNWAASSSKFSPSSSRLRSISCSKSWRRFSMSCRCRAAQYSCLSRSRS